MSPSQALDELVKSGWVVYLWDYDPVRDEGRIQLMRKEDGHLCRIGYTSVIAADTAAFDTMLKASFLRFRNIPISQPKERK